MEFWGEVGRLVSAFGSLSIAGAVGLIAYRQSVTARQKLALDLSGKRFELYRNLSTAVADAIAQSGKQSAAFAAGIETTDRDACTVSLVFSKAAKSVSEQQQKAVFLFGDDVLDEIAQIVSDLRLAALGYRKQNEALMEEVLERLAASNIGLQKACEPYMRMTHKVRAVF